MNVYIVAASDAEPDAERRLRWGDHWFKQSLGAAIERLGHTVTENALQAEVVVNCHGASVQHLPEWTFNVLWVIGHPDAVTPAECLEYDAVFAESAEFAAHIGGAHLPGASDMGPMDVPIEHDTVFVGNARPGRGRPCINELKDFAGVEVWGEGWQGLPAGVWKGPYYPHERLNELYAASRRVLNDTYEDMAKWGMHNPRYYDLLAIKGEQVPTFARSAAVLMECAGPTRVMYDLGCGRKPRPHMTGIDLQGGEGIIEHDLEQGLLALVGHPAVIVAENILEHLNNLIPLLNDCHRALQPTGRLHIRVPNAKQPVAAFADPTHVRYFVPETFDYFEANNPRWQEYGKSYGILPWRIVYRREVERFIDVMMRPADA